MKIQLKFFMSRIFIISSFIICSFLTIPQAEAQSDTEEKKINERITVGFGIGVDHSYIGAKIIYSLTDHWDIYTGLGAAQLVGLFPVLGVQYNFKKINTQKFSPYLLAQIGKDVRYGVNSDTSMPLTNVSRSKRFFTYNFGGGITFLKSPDSKYKLSIGVNYRIIDGSIQTFTDDFNMEFGTRFNENFNKILPMLSLQYKLDDLISRIKR